MLFTDSFYTIQIVQSNTRLDFYARIKCIYEKRNKEKKKLQQKEKKIAIVIEPINCVKKLCVRERVKEREKTKE